MSGVVGFAVFLIVMIVAFIVAAYGYTHGWWMRDECPDCRTCWASHSSRCCSCGRHPAHGR